MMQLLQIPLMIILGKLTINQVNWHWSLTKIWFSVSIDSNKQPKKESNDDMIWLSHLKCFTIFISNWLNNSTLVNVLSANEI